MKDRYDWESKVRYGRRWITPEAYRQIKQERVDRFIIFAVGFAVYWFVILPAVARIVERWVG